MPDLQDRLRFSVIPAVPVPFGPDGQIDHGKMRGYAWWMATQQVGAVAVWAHTGRGLLLSEYQRSEVMTTWCDALDDVPIICGVGASSNSPLPSEPEGRTDRVIDCTVEMARVARDNGASAVMVYPPRALLELPDNSPAVVELHRAVTEVGLPVIAFYLYEAAGGLSYSARTIEQVLTIPGVIGIKLATLDSVMTYQDIAAVVKQKQGALLITGEDRFLGYSLTLGADAALVGMAAACTDVSIALVNAWFQNDLAEFVRQSAALDKFAQVTFREPMEGYVQRMLWALEFDGVLPPGACDLFGPPMDESEREEVKRAVRKLRST